MFATAMARSSVMVVSNSLCLRQLGRRGVRKARSEDMFMRRKSKHSLLHR